VPPGGRRDDPASADLEPLLTAAGVLPIVVQQDLKRDERLALPKTVLDASQEVETLSELAGLVAEADLVVAPDGLLAHLAAAMGRPVWVIAPGTAHWPWGRSGRDSAWYPAARVFRRSATEDWAALIRRVA